MIFQLNEFIFKILKYFKRVFKTNMSDIPIKKTFNVLFRIHLYGYVEDIGFSQGTGPILFGYLDCNGTETNLVECTQNYNSTHT